MSNNKCIIPECYVDTCLIEVLIKAGKDHVNHQKGNGTVATQMKQKYVNGFCIGIIDEDRRRLDYLGEFDLIPALESRFLRIWKHKVQHQYIIQLRPLVEHWIFAICEEYSIDLTFFNLPHHAEALKRITKTTGSRKDERFIALFKEMLKRECEPVMQLAQWIGYLKEKTYAADINELRNGGRNF